MVTEEVKLKKKIAKRQSRFKLALSGFNRKYIDEAVKFYLDRGIDPMIISGIFGNISKESDWNPLANSKDNGLGDFYGLVLMSPDMRKEVKRVYGKVDANTTHLFIYDSMTGNKKISSAWRSYMNDYGGYWNNKYNDPETAAMAFGTVFERPSKKYADWGERMRSARDAYDHIISITNALKNAKDNSFGNPIKTTITADGNKVMTINPEYWEQLGMLQPVQKEQPVLQSILTEPIKTIAPRIEDVAPAPWDLNLLVLSRGIESTSQKSPFSLSLRLPSLQNMLQLDSPYMLMEQYFADALGVSDIMPEMPSLFPRFADGKVPNDPYERFKYSLPDNQKNTSESEYNTRRYWELNGRPKSFQEAVEREMYDLLEDGWHANSVAYNKDTGEYEFMKPRTHPTVDKELEWYNSDNAKEFRKKYKHIQPKNSNFDKYVPRYEDGAIPGLGPKKNIKPKDLQLSTKEERGLETVGPIEKALIAWLGGRAITGGLSMYNRARAFKQAKETYRQARLWNELTRDASRAWKIADADRTARNPFYSGSSEPLGWLYDTLLRPAVNAYDKLNLSPIGIILP